MPGGGTRVFLDSDLYEAGFRQAQIQFVIACVADFKSRLTWVELHHSQLLQCEEDCGRIGYVSLSPRLATVSFPTHADALPRWRGSELNAGDIFFHSPGEGLHQIMPGASIWSLIMVDPAKLDEYSRAVFRKPLPLPLQGRVLRASHRDAARLRRLHAQACRLAETKPRVLSHPQVARAIEHDLLYALVTCLSAAKTSTQPAANRRRAAIMVRFEEVLAEHIGWPLPMSQLCELVGVKDRTLRSCCAEFIGVSPTRYLLLRRLKEVRRALRNADAHTVDVAGIARRYGFTDRGRFAAAYQATFGEAPSATLSRPKLTS